MNNIYIQKPTIKYAKDIYNLVKNSPPLDINSPYSYALVCDYFADTSAIALKEAELIGFISGFLHQKNDSLFIWQVCVKESARGEGAAKSMLRAILQNNPHVKSIETTINPGNKPSLALFKSVAKEFGASLKKEEIFMKSSDFDESHEDEVRYVFER